ncbi:MAG: hypothetical protein ACPG5T_05385 [Endozoicomonas sp.]
MPASGSLSPEPETGDLSYRTPTRAWEYIAECMDIKACKYIPGTFLPSVDAREKPVSASCPD